MKRFACLALGVIAALVLLGPGSRTVLGAAFSKGAGAPAPNSLAALAPAAVSSSAAVTLTAAGFVPSVLTTTVGTLVVWHNATAAPQILVSGDANRLFLPLVARGAVGQAGLSLVVTEPAAPLVAGSLFSATIQPGGTFSYTFPGPGTFGYFLQNAPQFSGHVVIYVPDPALIAPPVDPGVATNLCAATQFLYNGSVVVQTGVVSGTVDCRRAAVLRGKVLTRAGAPLPDVSITIANHPEYGQTFSRADGLFDLAVNGGDQLTLQYARAGYLSAQRAVSVPWQDYVPVPDVALIAPDGNVTAIDLNAATPIQVARGSVINDSDGMRQETLFFAQGTTAVITLTNGAPQTLTTLHVRATEYTVGPMGPQAMPAGLPPTSAYTYATEFSADEATSLGASGPTFSKPVISYHENFLHFPAGTAVPVGYYDPKQALWVPTANGLVVKILSISGGLANLDVDGGGVPATAPEYAALDVSNAERAELAVLYPAGQSLWRVPLNHFSGWDSNWGISPPGNAKKPFFRPLTDLLGITCAVCPGTAVSVQTQVLGESVGVAGTPFTLNYASDRVPGRQTAYTLAIPLSDASLPNTVKRIDLTVSIAGRTFTQSFPAQLNQGTTFTWDGRDAYGRALQGQQTATVDVGYVYDGAYETNPKFGYHGNGTIITGDPARSELTLHEIQQAPIGITIDARGLGLGGWTLSVHHFYDPLGHVLYQGDGTRRNVQTVNDVIDTFGGHANPAFNGDGGPVKDAFFATPYGVAVGPDGSVYVADSGNARVRKIAPNGTVTTFAGNGSNCTPAGFPCGSGGPATQASIGDVTRLSIGPDGSVYIGGGPPILWKVAPNGIATIIAGGPTAGFSGDGGPATQAKLANYPRPFIAPDGSLYDVETNNNRIRRITPDGIITTVVGSNTLAFGGDGGPASQAQIHNPGDLAIAADGTVYFEDMDNLRIRQISPSGMITTTAGNGAFDDHGDGGPASQAGFILRNAHPQFSGSLAIGPDGTLYVVSFAGFGTGRVRRIGPDGIVTAVAGQAGNPTYAYTGDGGPATAAQMLLSALALAPDGSIYTVGGLSPDESRIRKIGPNLPGFSTAAITIPSANGNQLFVFDQYGRHLRTVDTLTGANRYVFGYDGAGRLVTVTDGYGNITTIQRNGAGTATAIVGPFGQQTGLQYDGNGYLSQVTDPLSHAYQFSYTAGGLLTGETDPRGNAKTFTYDPMGRLTQDADPAGGSQTLNRTELGANWTVTDTTALNRAASYQVQVLSTGGLNFVDTAPDHTQTLHTESPDGQRSLNLPDGTALKWAEGADPRWAMQAPVVTSASLTTPGGIQLSLAFTGSLSLANPLDPLSLKGMTDTLNFNGLLYTSLYNAGSRIFTDTTPAGRQAVAGTDAQSRPTSLQFANLFPLAYTYDSHGRLQTATVGVGGAARAYGLTYNPAGFLSTLTDPLGRGQGWGYDAAGQVVSQTLTDGRMISFTYDANGNLTSVTPPGGAAHTFAYNPVNLTAVYTPPVAFAGNNATQYLYNLDKQLRQIVRPDGHTVSVGFDSAGRTQAITITRGVYTYAYNGVTGHLSSITAPDGGVVSASYDGFLLTGQSWTGSVAGSVNSAYNNNLQPISQSVNGSNTALFSYDADGLLTQAGALSLTLDAQNGQLNATALGVVTDAWRYDGFGEPISYTAAITGAPVFARQYAYDKLGRITALTETIGATNVYTYGYDASGQLVAVDKNSAPYESYTYDSNGSRLTGSGPLGAFSAAYDVQDRLLHDGTYTYTYTANGELLARTNGALPTTYQYDELGNLLHVVLTNGTTIDYAVDGLDRRVGKKVNGVPVQGFLYQGDLNPVAELDGGGSVVSRFVYGSRANLPDYMVKGVVTYRLIADQLGSPRLVVNTATGAIAQQMDYDSFGNVLTDTNPGFQPFGFAGGLYDPATGLLRFGARDYDARAGRWMAKDPIGFAGRDANLYAYAGNDPVNFVDVDGTETVPAGWLGGGGENAIGVGLPDLPIGNTIATQMLIDDMKQQAERMSMLTPADTNTLPASIPADANRSPVSWPASGEPLPIGVGQPDLSPEKILAVQIRVDEMRRQAERFQMLIAPYASTFTTCDRQNQPGQQDSNNIGGGLGSETKQPLGKQIESDNGG